MEKRLRVAALQLASILGDPRENRKRATSWIKEAVAQGALLLVLPELFVPGYIPNPSIWEFAEDSNGPTIAWLRQLAKELSVTIGVGFLERAGRDFYNSYALVSSGGEQVSIVRKYAAEAYSFAKGRGSFVVTTPLGRVGIGICADNHFTAFLRQMREEQVDLMLMPHASPAPYKESKAVSKEDILRAKEKVEGVARLYAQVLGVPTIFVNPVGTLAPMAGLLGKFMTPALFSLAGCTRIFDYDGTLQGEFGLEEGALLASVTLGSRKVTDELLPDFSGWVHPGSFFVRKLLLPLDDALGRLRYTWMRAKRK